MGSNIKPTTYLFEDKPLFALDIGHGKARVMQIHEHKAKSVITGYGETTFDAAAIQDGVIVSPEIVAAAVQDLFKKHLVGDIITRRVAVAVPIAHAFTRFINVAGLTEKELEAAVQTEAEQYIPAATDQLYIDYTRLRTTDDKVSLFIVAVPKKIVDSYVTLTQLLALEAVVIQTSGGANAQLFERDAQSDVPTVLVDFGNESADITIYDNGPVISGTVACGGQQLTRAIAKSLGTTEKEAALIKTKYGLNRSKKQAQITTALNPALSLLIKEIKRTIRYYTERNSGSKSISQIVTTGGGANMPGLSEYLTDSLRLAVRSLDPTSYVDFGHLQPFNATEHMSYVTAVGLAIIDPREIFE